MLLIMAEKYMPSMLGLLLLKNAWINRNEQ